MKSLVDRIKILEEQVKHLRCCVAKNAPTTTTTTTLPVTTTTTTA